MVKPKISVIVPAYNEEGYIRDTLRSARDQTFSDLELIVISNASTDDTANVARCFTPSVYEIPEKGSAIARNYGARKAEGEILVFLDSDTVMNPNLLSRVLDTIDQGYVGGKAEVFPRDSNFYNNLFWWADNLVDRILFYNLGIPNICSYSPFIFCRKDSFVKVGGFDEERYVGEDINLLSKLKRLGKINFIKDSSVVTSSRRVRMQGKFYGGFWLPFFHFFFPKSNLFSYSDVR